METKLWSALIGLSKTVDSNPKTEHTDSIIMDCLQHLKNHTVTQDLIDYTKKKTRYRQAAKPVYILVAIQVIMTCL